MNWPYEYPAVAGGAPGPRPTPSRSWVYSVPFPGSLRTPPTSSRTAPVLSRPSAAPPSGRLPAAAAAATTCAGGSALWASSAWDPGPTSPHPSWQALPTWPRTPRSGPQVSGIKIYRNVSHYEWSNDGKCLKTICTTLIFLSSWFDWLSKGWDITPIIYIWEVNKKVKHNTTYFYSNTLSVSKHQNNFFSRGT